MTTDTSADNTTCQNSRNSIGIGIVGIREVQHKYDYRSSVSTTRPRQFLSTTSSRAAISNSTL